MKITLENGKQIEISEESYKQLAESIKEDFVIDNDSSIITYKYIMEMSDDQQKIKTTEKKDFHIYVNKVFADNSIFGIHCIFIKCKFGSDCEFGSGCEFGSYCEFSSSCEFGSDCKFGSGCKKQTPYWDEYGLHK